MAGLRGLRDEAYGLAQVHDSRSLSPPGICDLQGLLNFTCESEIEELVCVTNVSSAPRKQVTFAIPIIERELIVSDSPRRQIDST